MRKLIMDKENWIKWLQARIPELKKPYNGYWLNLAMHGYLKDEQKKIKKQAATP